MTLRRFLMNKLVRDKALDAMQKEGVIAHTQILTDNDMYLEALSEKIVEELEEVFSAHSTEELVEELADLEEILSEFKKLVKITQAQIDQARAKKSDKKGLFTSRLYCDYIDVPETAKDTLKYVLDKEDKYPELDPKTNEFLSDEHEYEDEDDGDLEECED